MTNLTVERRIERIRKLDACGPYYRNEVRWWVVKDAESPLNRQVLHCFTRRKDAKSQIRAIESFAAATEAR